MTVYEYIYNNDLKLVVKNGKMFIVEDNDELTPITNDDRVPNEIKEYISEMDTWETVQSPFGPITLISVDDDDYYTGKDLYFYFVRLSSNYDLFLKVCFADQLMLSESETWECVEQCMRLINPIQNIMENYLEKYPHQERNFKYIDFFKNCFDNGQLRLVYENLDTLRDFIVINTGGLTSKLIEEAECDIIEAIVDKQGDYTVSDDGPELLRWRSKCAEVSCSECGECEDL